MNDQVHELNLKWCKALLQEACCSGKKPVMGEGKDLKPAIMLIGEAPGAQEEAQGRPFVGKAGQNLNEFLALLGLEREQIYITNAVKIRPSVLGASGKEKNRPPTRKEVELFTPWLKDEIRSVKPRLIVTLGNTPLRVVYGTEAVIGNFHGKLMQTPEGLALFPLYHPAAVIYNRALRSVYEEDLERLKAIL